MTPFSAIFVPQELRDAVSDQAWLQGMLDAERALANAGAALGVVPEDAAARIAGVCRAELFDAAAIADAGREVGNPAEPLVRELRKTVGDAADYVHLGATSQDIVDTAAMLVSRNALDLVSETSTGSARSAPRSLGRTGRPRWPGARSSNRQCPRRSGSRLRAGWSRSSRRAGAL